MVVMGALSIWAMMQKKEAVKQKTEAVKQKGIAEDKQEEAETAREGEAKERKKAETELKKAQAVSEFVGGIFTAVEPGELENASDDDKNKRAKIVDKAYKLAYKEHTWEKRVFSLLNLIHKTLK